MRHDKLEKQLYLLQLLTENRSYTLDKLCDKLDLSLRNLYYYLDFFRDSGFHLYKHGDYYCIDRDSPFFTRLFDRITFTEEEAITMRRLLDKVDKQSAIVQHLKNKLDKFYDFHILDSSAELDEHNARLGFDYVMVNGRESSVMVAVGLFDEEGVRLSMTNPIEVPLKRSMLTTVKGSFLMQDTGGGVAIDPAFDGEYNIIIR